MMILINHGKLLLEKKINKNCKQDKDNNKPKVQQHRQIVQPQQTLESRGNQEIQHVQQLERNQNISVISGDTIDKQVFGERVCWFGNEKCKNHMCVFKHCPIEEVERVTLKLQQNGKAGRPNIRKCVHDLNCKRNDCSFCHSKPLRDIIKIDQ